MRETEARDHLNCFVVKNDTKVWLVLLKCYLEPLTILFMITDSAMHPKTKFHCQNGVLGTLEIQISVVLLIGITDNCYHTTYRRLTFLS
jgi:hypothetical protein